MHTPCHKLQYTCINWPWSSLVQVWPFLAKPELHLEVWYGHFANMNLTLKVWFFWGAPYVIYHKIYTAKDLLHTCYYCQNQNQGQFQAKPHQLPWADHHNSQHTIFAMHQISLLLFDNIEDCLFMLTLNVLQGRMMQGLPYNLGPSVTWQDNHFPELLTRKISVECKLNRWRGHLPPTMEWPQDMLALRPMGHRNIVQVLQKGSHQTGGDEQIHLAGLLQWYSPSSYQHLIDLIFYGFVHQQPMLKCIMYTYH